MGSGQVFPTGDRFYRLHTRASRTRVKFAAVGIGVQTDALGIRVGSHDQAAREIKACESGAAGNPPKPRSIACGRAAVLQGGR